jgi:hypothetical protein
VDMTQRDKGKMVARSREFDFKWAESGVKEMVGCDKSQEEDGPISQQSTSEELNTLEPQKI